MKALAFVALLALVVMLAIWHSPSPVVEETWRDAAMPLVFKSAALASIPAPKIVQVEPVKVECGDAARPARVQAGGKAQVPACRA
jgi:hypothetical protein